MDLSNYKLNLFNEESKITNTRQEVVKEFLDALNKERENTRFRKLTAKKVAIDLSIMSEQEMRMFLSICKEYQNIHGSFGKRYFGGLKQQDFREEKNCA